LEFGIENHAQGARLQMEPSVDGYWGYYLHITNAPMWRLPRWKALRIEICNEWKTHHYPEA
jgi:hypothetical protein